MTSHDPLSLTRRRLRRGNQSEPAVKPLTVLMVCTGNVCRSPMAEAMLRARLGDLDVRVHSAGTRALIGHSMTKQAQRVAVARGASRADAAAHRARWLTDAIVADADLILGMSRRHVAAVVELAPHLASRTFTAREFGMLIAGLPDEGLRGATTASNDERARLAAAVALVDARRRTATPIAPEKLDVVAPFRRMRWVYRTAGSQLAPAIDSVARVLQVAK